MATKLKKPPYFEVDTPTGQTLEVKLSDEAPSVALMTNLVKECWKHIYDADPETGEKKSIPSKIAGIFRRRDQSPYTKEYKDLGVPDPRNRKRRIYIGAAAATAMVGLTAKAFYVFPIPGPEIFILDVNDIASSALISVVIVVGFAQVTEALSAAKKDQRSKRKILTKFCRALVCKAQGKNEEFEDIIWEITEDMPEKRKKRDGSVRNSFQERVFQDIIQRVANAADTHHNEEENRMQRIMDIPGPNVPRVSQQLQHGGIGLQPAPPARATRKPIVRLITGRHYQMSGDRQGGPDHGQG